jgi:Ni/Co efflux regulator RcnB
MKKILSAALAVSLIASAGAASAKPYDRHQQDNRIEKYERKADKAERKAIKAQAKYERAAARRYYAGRYQRPAGYREHHWRQGERLPASYRTRAYAVDHQRYGLQAPPRGYQYTRIGNDVALASTTNGLIASMILGLFQ